MYMPAADSHATQSRPREEGAGPIIGAIIIIILLVFGALYFWGQKLNKKPAPDAPLVRSQVSID
jgi:uncharacterized membrane protein